MENEKKKTGYQPTWQDQLKETANKIINREKFSYDLNGDALYKQYKDRYTQQGKQAMMDTMGQAQTMTGGYGNSYAHSVGQQTYQGYMQGLNDQIPALYQIALDKYTAEGNRMRDNMNLMMQQDDIEYGRYRDKLADQDAAYSKLMALMTGYGYKPTAEEMAAAGMTEAQMNAIMGLNNPVAKKRPDEDLDEDPPKTPTFGEIHQTADHMKEVLKATPQEINEYLNAQMQAGIITTDQRKSLKYTFGL